MSLNQKRSCLSCAGHCPPCSAEDVGVVVLKVVKMFAGSMDKGGSIC